MGKDRRTLAEPHSLGAVSGSVLTAGLAVQILAFGAAPGMGMYPAGGGCPWP